MSLLKALGIDKYTTRFKQWIRDKFIAKGGLKTINGESIEGDGDIEIKGGADSYEDIYIIEDFTAKDIEFFEEGSLQIDGQGLSEAINNNKKIYIKYTNLASEPGMILCTTYKEDLYYISFRLNSSIYGFDIGEDSQHIDKNSIFKTDIQEQLESGKNIKTINGESLIGEGNIEISGGGSSVNADWNAQESEAGYIKNKPFEEKILYNLGRIYNAGGEYIDGDYHIKLGNITPRYDEYSGYTFPNFHLTGYLGFDEETGNDHFVNIISLAGQYPIYKYDSIPDAEDIPYTIYLEETTEFNNYDVYLKTRLQEIKYDLVCNIVEISTLNELFIPDTIARKSDINNTTKNITTDFGITIENLLGDYEDYYTFWEYVTQGYNTINYNNDENTIAFPISMRENSEILGNSIYIPYPDGQIEIYYSDGSGLGGKIIKTFVDPIVYKYICNPCVIKSGEVIPEELLDENLNLKYPYPNMYRSYHEGDYYVCILNNGYGVDDTFGTTWVSDNGVWSTI